MGALVTYVLVVNALVVFFMLLGLGLGVFPRASIVTKGDAVWRLVCSLAVLAWAAHLKFGVF